LIGIQVICSEKTRAIGIVHNKYVVDPFFGLEDECLENNLSEYQSDHDKLRRSEIQANIDIANHLHHNNTVKELHTISISRRKGERLASDNQSFRSCTRRRIYYHQRYTPMPGTPRCLQGRCRGELDTIPAELTMKDFAGKIKSWQESTTTSPSGRHLGEIQSDVGYQQILSRNSKI
jgi:hypothetical protein